MRTPHPTPRTGVRLLLLIFVLLAGLYSVIVPPFETPDEIWHFAFIQHLVTRQALPVSAPNTQALWRQQGVQAPGYYLLAAALTAPVDQSDFPALYDRANPHAAIGRPDATINRNYLIHYPEEGWLWTGSIFALHIARLFSVLLGGVTVYATYRALQLLVGTRDALLGAAFIAAIPQFLFISSAASNDNAINAMAALVLWQLVEMVAGGEGEAEGRRQKVEGKRQRTKRETDEFLHPQSPPHPTTWSPGRPVTPSPRHLVILGILLGLALLSKLSGLGLVGVAGLTILWLAGRARRGRLLLEAAVWTGVPTLLIAGWWYMRNWRLYGDPLAWNIWQANILLRVVPGDWRTVLGELGSLERSFWGLFGWLDVPYPEWIYWLLRGLEMLLVLGLILGVGGWAGGQGKRQRAKGKNRASRLTPYALRITPYALPLLWLLLLTVSWLRFMRIAPAAQGRYFFPAAPALALLFVWGWRGWGARVGVRGGWLAVAGLFVLSAVTPWAVIRPAYAPPPMQPATATQPLAVFGPSDPPGPQIALVAASAPDATLHPGAAVPITLTWRSLAPGSVDYSVFIHLRDEVGLVVAQIDTMPGGGLSPTSHWEPGTELSELYTVRIPDTVYTPDRGRWVAGLYDHRTGARLPRLDAEGDVVALGAAHIDPPSTGGGVPNPVSVDFADNVSLGGYRFSRRVLRPGDPVTVTLYWRARGPVTRDYTTFVHLLDENDQMHGGHDAPPDPPTPAWPPEDVVEDVHTFALSPDAPPGLYRFEIGLYTGPDFQRLRRLTAEGAEGADRLLLGPVRVE